MAGTSNPGCANQEIGATGAEEFWASSNYYGISAWHPRRFLAGLREKAAQLHPNLVITSAPDPPEKVPTTEW